MANKQNRGVGVLMQIAKHLQEAVQMVISSGYSDQIDVLPVWIPFGNAVEEIVRKYLNKIQVSWQSSDPKKQDWNNKHSVLVFSYGNIRISVPLRVLMERDLVTKVRIKMVENLFRQLLEPHVEQFIKSRSQSGREWQILTSDNTFSRNATKQNWNVVAVLEPYGTENHTVLGFQVSVERDIATIVQNPVSVTPYHLMVDGAKRVVEATAEATVHARVKKWLSSVGTPDRPYTIKYTHINSTWEIDLEPYAGRTAGRAKLEVRLVLQYGLMPICNWLWTTVESVWNLSFSDRPVAEVAMEQALQSDRREESLEEIRSPFDGEGKIHGYYCFNADLILGNPKLERLQYLAQIAKKRGVKVIINTFTYVPLATGRQSGSNFVVGLPTTEDSFFSTLYWDFGTVGFQKDREVKPYYVSPGETFDALVEMLLAYSAEPVNTIPSDGSGMKWDGKSFRDIIVTHKRFVLVK